MLGFFLGVYDRLLINFIENKKLIFITTKNIDYIRNMQEVKILEKYAKNVKIVYSNKKKYFGRILEIWKKLIQINIQDIDVIFIGFAPQLILPLFRWKFKKKIIIIDFFISVYDTLVHDRKKFRDKGIIAKLCHSIDSYTLKHANYVIADTKADAKYFIEEFHSDKSKFETLYLEADQIIYYPREQQKKEELQNKFVVLYFGSILPLQGVDVVLDAIRMLKDEQDIFFQIIGPIPEKYNKPIQQNVEYIEWLSQEELAQYIANADLCLAGHFSGEIDKAKRTIPGKAYIYAAMGKKMILGKNEANLELYNASNKKISYVEMGNSKVLAENVLINRNRIM